MNWQLVTSYLDVVELCLICPSWSSHRQPAADMDVRRQLEQHCTAEMTDEQPAAETVAMTTVLHTAPVAAAAVTRRHIWQDLHTNIHCIFTQHLSSKLQLDVCCLSCCGGDIWWMLTKAGMVLFAGKTVWSMLERFECTTLAKKVLYKYSSFLPTVTTSQYWVCPTRHKIYHFGDVLPSQGSYRELCEVFQTFPRKIADFPNFSRWFLPPCTSMKYNKKYLSWQNFIVDMSRYRLRRYWYDIEILAAERWRYIMKAR